MDFAVSNSGLTCNVGILDMLDNRELLPPYFIRIVDGKIISVMEKYVP